MPTFLHASRSGCSGVELAKNELLQSGSSLIYNQSFNPNSMAQMKTPMSNKVTIHSETGVLISRA